MAEYKRAFSEEQKEAWKEQAREREEEAFAQIRQVAEGYQRDPLQMIEYLSFASRFYQYSQKNISLIYAQNPYATFVKSFKGWKEMGESVKSGAKGLKIFVPVKTTYLETGEEEWTKLSLATPEQKQQYKEGKIKSSYSLNFKLGSVFDISQTTYPKEKYPELFSMGYTSDRHKELTEGLIRFSEDVLHCPVSTESVDSITLYGYYVPAQHRIVLNELMEDNMRLSTMSHELGHALIHHTASDKTTAQKEFEGDAISIMLQAKYEIELTEERRSHLARHYKLFYEECEQKALKEGEGLEHKKITERANAMVEEAFEDVFTVYKKHIGQIEQCVDQKIQIEKTEDVRREQDEDTVHTKLEEPEQATEEAEQDVWEHGHLIEERRNDLQISRTELAYLSMISMEELENIEAGMKKPDDVTLLLIANTLGVYTAALEEGKIVEQKRKDITEVIQDIREELEEIARTNDYVKEYLQAYGVECERYRVYPEKEAEEVYVIYDTLEETYLTNADGTRREWENIHDARIYASWLNEESLGIEEPSKELIHISGEKGEFVPNFGTEKQEEKVVPNFGTEGKKETVPDFGTKQKDEREIGRVR